MMHLELWREPDTVYAEKNNGWSRLERKGTGSGAWNGAGVDVWTTLIHEEWQVRTASATPLHTLQLRWNVTVKHQLTFLGDHWERAYGDLEWRGLQPERVMPWYFLTCDGKSTNGYGVKTGPNAMCSWHVDSEGVTLTADVRCGNAGVLLGDRILDVCTIVTGDSAQEESPFAFARRFCSFMCPSPVLPDHPVYGGNNWYYAYGESSHEKILEDSRFIASLAPAGGNRPYMVIDDGWQLCSGPCNGGPWIGNYRFPDMPGLATGMKAAGVRPGIWIRPLLATQKLPESWVRYRNDGQFLDPSVPGVLQYIEETVRTMVSWGFELIKHDFSTFDILGKWGFEMGGSVTNLPYTFSDRSRTTAEIILQLYRTIAAASQDSVIIGCNTIGHLAAGLFEIQRTGDDTSGRAWERTRRMGINTLAFRMPQHGTFFSHDADCVGITDKVPWKLNRQWLQLLAESGTPLFVSAEPSLLTEEQKAQIAEAFRLASDWQEPAEPLDWLGNTCPRSWSMNGRTAEFQWNDGSPSMHGSDDNLWWK